MNTWQTRCWRRHPLKSRKRIPSNHGARPAHRHLHLRWHILPTWSHTWRVTSHRRPHHLRSPSASSVPMPLLHIFPNPQLRHIRGLWWNRCRRRCSPAMFDMLSQRTCWSFRARGNGRFWNFDKEGVEDVGGLEPEILPLFRIGGGSE